MKLITLYVPEPYLRALDQLINERYYPNRAEAIRVAIRDLLTAEVWSRVEDLGENAPAKTLQKNEASHCPVG